jgi:gamma-glutamyltranspeptidase/glutathione hydrolase
LSRRRRAWFAVLPLAGAAVLAGCGGDSDPVADNACLQVSPSGQIYNPGTPGLDGAPEIPTGFASRKVSTARSFMVVAANPLAAKAGCDVLNKGGSAVDAAVATQMVLTLVEPQSSGIGGGAFMLYYDAATGRVTAYDGRETAPAAATENYLRWVSDSDRTTPKPNARASGRSIGTPGVVHMLDTAHREAGRLTWKELFDPAIRIAEEGFRISPRMAASIAASATSLQRDPEARAYFLNADGSGKAAGTLLRSPALAATYRTLAAGGAAAFYGGAIAQDIVDEIADTTGGITPGQRRWPTWRPTARRSARPCAPPTARNTSCAACRRRRRAAWRWRRRWASSNTSTWPRSSRPPSTTTVAVPRCSVCTCLPRPTAWPMPTATNTWQIPTSCRCPVAAPPPC